MTLIDLWGNELYDLVINHKEQTILNI